MVGSKKVNNSQNKAVVEESQNKELTFSYVADVSLNLCTCIVSYGKINNLNLNLNLLWSRRLRGDELAAPEAEGYLRRCRRATRCPPTLHLGVEGMLSPCGRP